MDIIVEGTKTKSYKPNEININLTFTYVHNEYDICLEEGLKLIDDFVFNTLSKLKIDKENFKTRNFQVRHKTKFDYQNNKEIDLGYEFREDAFINLDYSVDIIANFIEEISKIKNGPKYMMTFGLKELEEAKKEVLKLSYKEMEDKAKVIAEAAGLSLKRCLKVDFKPFTETIISNSNLNEVYAENSARFAKASSASEVVSKTFIPEDIQVSQTLYSLWLAE